MSTPESDNSSPGIDIVTSDAFEKFLLDEHNQNIQEEQSSADGTFLLKLENLCRRSHMSFDENVFEYFEKIRNEDDDIYELAITVLAAPATQVSVERAFSSLGILMHYKRCSLKEDTIDDILVCHLNQDILSFVNYEELAH